jgi:hypothetical protein
MNMSHNLTLLTTLLTLGVAIESFAQFSTNNSPQNQIRFGTEKEANDKREQLARFIWREGVPLQSMPIVKEKLDSGVYVNHLTGVDLSMVSRVDKLVTNVLGVDSLIYLMYPKKGPENPRLGIVHAGHSVHGPLSEHYPRTIDCLLKRGVVTAMIHMPQHGWNDDETAELANGKKVTIRLNGFRENHAAIVNLPQYDIRHLTSTGRRVPTLSGASGRMY